MSKSDWLKRRASVRARSLEPLLKLTLPALEARSPTPEGWPAGLALRPAETNNARVNQRLCKRRNVAEPAA